MSDVHDDRGLSWKERAELAEEVIAEARLAGLGGASAILWGHSARLAHAHRLAALRPYLRQAHDDLMAKGVPFPIDEVLDRAEEIKRAAA